MICSLYDLPVDLGFSSLISKEPFLFWYNLLIKSPFHSTWWFLDWVFLSPRIQEYTEEWYKKDLHDPDNHDGMITHLEQDILECEVKRALGTSLWTKLVEVMEFQLSYFKSIKMMLWKRCTQYASKFGKLSSGHRTGKGFHSNPKERQCQRMFKLLHNCTHLTH